MKKQNTVLRLAAQLKRQRLRLSFIGISIILYVILSIRAPMYSAIVVDDLWKSVQACRQTGAAFRITWDDLGFRLTWLTIQYIGIGIFYFLQSYLMANVAENLVLELRKQVSVKLSRLPLRFYDRNKAGELLSRVTSDLDKMSEVMQTGLLKLVVAIGTVIGSLAVMFWYSVPLTLLFLAFMAASTAITKIVAKKSLRSAEERLESISSLTGLAEEAYNGRNVIRAYNHEAESKAQIEKAAEEARITNQRVDFLSNCVNPLLRLITRISQVCIALITGRALLDGTMTVGVVQAFFQYINQTSEPLTEASYMINSLQAALAAAKRTFELLDEAEEIPDPADPENPEQIRGDVSFEHVKFSYDPEKPLMKDISFHAEPGRKIAIVGTTGAGKTTLVNLLMRFYEIDGGQILLDGIPTTSMTRSGLRSCFGMVLQDSWLFGGTIAENIAYGRPDAAREEVIRAAKAARVDYLIRTLPQGYDTVLNNEASNFSAGQRQLLTIARVFLCNPPILILDEATSNVDTRTELEINKAMSQLMAGRTCFVIAHRLSTIRNADCILYMEHGTITEQGTHAQLLKKGGTYAALYNSQFE